MYNEAVSSDVDLCRGVPPVLAGVTENLGIDGDTGDEPGFMMLVLVLRCDDGDDVNARDGRGAFACEGEWGGE